MSDELEQIMEEQRHDEGAAMESHGCCGTCRYWRESDEKAVYRQQIGFCDAPVPAWCFHHSFDLGDGSAKPRVHYYEFRADQCSAYKDGDLRGCLDDVCQEAEQPQVDMEEMERHQRMEFEIRTLGEILETLEHAEVFTKSRERMHPDGRALYLQAIRKVRDWRKGLQDRLGYEKGGA